MATSNETNGQGDGGSRVEEVTEATTPRDERSRAVVTRTAVVSAALGAVLSPIPLADELVLLPIYGVMAARSGKAHRLPLRRIPWSPIARTALTGLGVRAGLNVAFAFVPGVAAVANATSAAALTMLLGRAFDDACRSPDDAKAVSPAAMLEALRRTFSQGVRSA